MSNAPPPDPSTPVYVTRPAPAGAPPQVIIQQTPPTAFGRYGKLLVLALFFAVMTIIGQHASYRSYFSPAGELQEKFQSLSETAEQKIAIIKVTGAILETDGFIKKQIDRVREDKDVVAIVLRIDSPGGTVTGSDYLYHHLRDLVEERKLPIVVSMGSICASGGYYLAMAAGDKPDVIFAEPTTWTGSIGVVIPHYDLSGLLENWHVTDDSIASHKLKLLGSPTRKLDAADRAEEQKVLQDLVDESFERFKNIVRSGRPKLKADNAALDKVATGQVFTADQALADGLIDKIGFVEDAIRRAAELAGRDPDTLRCVKYEEPASPLGALVGVQSGGSPASKLDMAALLDLTAPRAYFLCTWLPSVLSNNH